jgi:hypothetical protein
MRSYFRGLLCFSAAVVALLACAPSSQFFLDRQHRADYALQTDELEQAQFYVAEEIVAHELGPSGTLEGPEHIVVIALGTPGVVTEAGPHWLRVSFGSGRGVFFVADPEAKPDSIYLLGTEPEDGRLPVRVQNLDDKVVRLGERRYRVIHGADARLLIDNGDLERMLHSRPQAPGRERP